MRRSILAQVFLIIGIIIFAGQQNVQAKNPRPYKFFIAGDFGFAISPEEFTDYYSTGFGLEFGIEYPTSPNWSLIGMFDIKRFSPAAGMIKDWWTEPGEYPGATNIDVSGGGVTAGSLAVLGKGSLKSEGARFFPYVKGGFGLTIAGADEIKVTYESGGSPQTSWVSGLENETNFSVFLGLGVEKIIGEGKSSWFLEAGIHMIMMEDVNPTIAPITFGLKF